MKVIAVVALFLLDVVVGVTPDARVVNGDIVDPPNSFPWQLSLQYGTSHICGAVVYNSNYVLTAAHCVDGGVPSQYRVLCGSHDIYAYESTRQTVTVASITKHPQYNPNGNGFPNDVAVLRLASPLTLNSVCAAAKLDTGTTYNNDAGVITGWGRMEGNGALPRELRRGDVEVLSHSTCRNYWGSVVSSNYHICVKDLGDRYYGACQGDSGGPAHAGDTVIGLASFVASGCLPEYPSVYARISNYISWIQTTVATMG